jgi:chromosome segregation ATPase
MEARMRSAFLLPLFTVAVSFAQTPSQDMQVTQALLAEIRLLRQDLQATAATIQRVQLVMFRMQTATATLNRATQRLDDARNRCNYVQPQRKTLTVQIEQAENRQKTTQNPADSRLVEEIARLKGNLEMLAVQEQQCQSTLLDADSQVRAEQAKMNEIQDQFDKLDRALADVTRK